MDGEIRLGKTYTKASDLGACNVTITEVKLENSRFQPVMTTRDGRTVDNVQLALTFRSDDGRTGTGFYGGVYPNSDGTIGFGRNGHARALITTLQNLGFSFPTIHELKGLRFHAAPVKSVFNGKESIKLFPDGPATTPPSSAAPVVVAGVPARPDGRRLFEALKPGEQDVLSSFVRNPRLSQQTIVDSIVDAKITSTREEAEAIAAYAKSVPMGQ